MEYHTAPITAAVTGKIDMRGGGMTAIYEQQKGRIDLPMYKLLTAVLVLFYCACTGNVQPEDNCEVALQEREYTVKYEVISDQIIPKIRITNETGLENEYINEISPWSHTFMVAGSLAVRCTVFSYNVGFRTTTVSIYVDEVLFVYSTKSGSNMQISAYGTVDGLKYADEVEVCE